MSFLENATNIASALIPGVKAATAVQKAQGENFQDPDAYVAYTVEITKEKTLIDKISDVADQFGGITNIFIFLVAAYLSWSCNTRCYKSMGVIEKVIRAFFAGFFGLIYLIIYFVSWSADCNKCSEILRPQSPYEILPSQSIYF